MNQKLTALGIAVIAFLAMVFLGVAVDHAPDPGWLMGSETAWVDHGTLVAWWLTWLCYPYVLGPVCVGLIVVAIRYPRWRWPIAFSIAALLLAWRGDDLLQHLFARPRRLDWVVKHETSFSYPSSHAAIVTAFYLLWSVLVARSSLNYRTPVALGLAVVGFGIMWSRLALGAHYLTDIVGGILLGIAIVGVLAAVVPTNIFEGRRPVSLE